MAKTTFTGKDLKAFWADKQFWLESVYIDDVLLNINGIDRPQLNVEDLADADVVSFSSGYAMEDGSDILPNDHPLTGTNSQDLSVLTASWLQRHAQIAADATAASNASPESFDAWWNETEVLSLRSGRLRDPDEAARAAWDQSREVVLERFDEVALVKVFDQWTESGRRGGPLELLRSAISLAVSERAGPGLPAPARDASAKGPR